MVKCLSFLALLLSVMPVAAQTPQQIEMLRSRGEEYEVPVMTPELMQKEMQRLQNELNEDKTKTSPEQPMQALPLERSEMGANTFTIPKDLTQQEIKQLAKQLVEDKIIITLQKFQVIDGGVTPPTCSFETTVLNTTKMPLKRLFIYYKFGESETYADFSTIAAGAVGGTRIAMAGEACRVITSKPSLRVINCELGNLSEEACKSRLMML